MPWGGRGHFRCSARALDLVSGVCPQECRPLPAPTSAGWGWRQVGREGGHHMLLLQPRPPWGYRGGSGIVVT